MTIIFLFFKLLFCCCNGTCCCCMMSKPVYFKIKMWICCITVHIVIDQIFDNRLFPFFSLSSFHFFVNTTPGCSLLKNWILFSRRWKKKNAWTFDFVLKPLSCVFCIAGGEMFEHNTFESEKSFSTRRCVAGLLEECYRMCFRRTLKRYDEAF